MLTSQQLAETMEYLRAHGLSGASEKRRATRMPVQSKIQAGRLQDGRVVQSFTMLTKDISLKGLGLLTGVQSEVGKELIVILPRLEKPPLNVKARIRHCRDLADNIYSVGTEFAGELSAEVAKMLEQLGAAERQRVQQSILE